jgi:hypothetical protein
MKITTEKYPVSQSRLPSAGRYIIAHQTTDEIVVYQAYKPSIARYAVAHQVLGGNDFSFSRMSWIKPNFLWMMFRCGWAKKENQERVLALWINKPDFEKILLNAVQSSFKETQHVDYAHWKESLHTSDVRLQWDPDHDPYGNKLARKAIQVGLRGKSLEHFVHHQINCIEDITDFVHDQKEYVKNNTLDQLCIPVEEVWHVQNEILTKRIDLSSNEYKNTI